MDKNIEISLLEILDTMKEALAHLEHTENEELRQMVKSGRQHLTEALESELDCSLDQRIDASALSGEGWVRTG